MILEKPLVISTAKVRDQEALHEWVQRHYDDIYRFLKHLTRQREAAEDLAQQTFINAYQALGGFREDSSMRTWLHRIAFREYIAWRRKRRLTLPLELLGGKSDKRFKGVESNIDLLAALHQLPAAYREAFLLYEVQQLSVEEVSSVTGTKVGTIKSQLHHARKQLQQLLGEVYQETNHESE